MREMLDFLQLICPIAPYYCVGAIGPSTGGRWQNFIHTDFQSMVEQSMALSAANNNTYFALSGFGQGLHQNSKGKTVFRTQSNAVSQKAFWFDIDAGKQNCKYKSEYEALSALKTFIQTVGLPVPNVVFSGQGLHVYWALNEAIRTQTWERVARLLWSAAVAHQLHVDHSRTRDAASVLRIPGTTNYGKDGKSRPVRWALKAPSVEGTDFLKVLLAYAEPVQAPAGHEGSAMLVVPPPPSALPMPDALQLAGIKKTPFRIVKECEQIKQSGVGTYDQWYGMMLVMKHCERGEEVVHYLSACDSTRYDRATTEAKYRQAVDGGAGPCRCDTFNSKVPGVCPNCPYWEKISTPLQLGEAPKVAASIEVPAVNPERIGSGLTTVAMNTAKQMQLTPYDSRDFTVTPGVGVVYHKRELVSDQGGEPKYITKDIVICEAELYLHSKFIDNTQDEIKANYVFRKRVVGRAEEDIQMGMDVLTQAKMIEWLGNNGALPHHPKFFKLMGDFMLAYIASLQNKLPEIYVREYFGWVRDCNRDTGEEEHNFVVGDNLFSKDGVSKIRLNPRAARVAKDFQQRGSLDEWKEIPKMYRLFDQKFAMLMVCGGFGATFMKFNPGTATNCTYNIWDILGGKGKSNILRLICSIWGDPAKLMKTKNDSYSSRYQFYSVCNNLPVCIDELTEARDEEVAGLLYDICNGRERTKSNSGGTQIVSTGSWETQSFFTSNRSIYGMMRAYSQQSNATAMRVIEWRCDFEDYSNTEYAPYIVDLINKMGKNYGFAGPVFLNYIFSNPKLLDIIPKVAAQWAEKHTKNSDERFWMHSIGLNLACGRIAVEAGLLDYDISDLENWVLSIMLPTLRRSVRVAKPTGGNILNDFFNEHQANILVVKTARRPKHMPDLGSFNGMDPYVNKMPIGPVVARIEADTKIAEVSKRAFTKWHKDNHLVLDATLQDIASEGGFGNRGPNYHTFDLGKDVSVIARGSTQCYRIDLRRLEKEVADNLLSE